MRRSRLLLVALLLITAWLYKSSLQFGYVWDDPLFFGRLLDRPVMSLLQPIPGFHFYRPGVMIYNRLFAGAQGRFAALPHHAAQLGWHLLNVALMYALTRRLSLPHATAAAAATLFALHPFSHQAVVWTQAQHPLATTVQLGAWLAFLVAYRRRMWQVLAASLLLYVLALTIQESTVPMALVPAAMVWAARGRPGLRTPGVSSWRRDAWNWTVLLFPLLAAAYTLLWLAMPRQPGVTTLGREAIVADYLLQGLVYPLLGRPSGYGSADAINTAALLGLVFVAVAILLSIARVRGRGRLALLGLAWALLGILPPLVGLPYSYVKLGPRLVYVATPGTSLIWAVALTAAIPRRGRLLGQALLILIAVQSAWILLLQQNMWREGASLQATMISASASNAGRPQIYLNYPDRYSLKRPPYPLGYWGVTLAPVVQQLGDYTELQTGAQPSTQSWSMPWLDAAARPESPFEVDLRGSAVDGSELYAAAISGDVLYVVQPGARQAFELQEAGQRLPAESGAGCLVVFDDRLCLQEMRPLLRADHLLVSLTWHYLETVDGNLSVFLHLGQPGNPPLAQADGDFWLGLLSLTVPAEGDVLQEWRRVPLSGAIPGELSLGVGLYRRDTGERLSARLPTGGTLPFDTYAIRLSPQIAK